MEEDRPFEIQGTFLGRRQKKRNLYWVSCFCDNKIEVLT